ncbi:MAG TPA: DUF4175 domain-containing protein [Polyangiaceae bacterium]|nr:DUF4175 domain-containing protein [Polyangiaceae bacterium]
MAAESPVDRIRRAWRLRESGAAEQALIALFIAAVIGGAHVARIGTAWARAATATGIAAVVVLQILHSRARRREAASARLTVRRVLAATDPVLGERALRALTLVERAGADEAVGSEELAALHFRRIVDRASSEAVGAAAGRHAEKLRGAALGLLSAALVGVVIGPIRVVEGLDVLAARHGRAPLTMSWLGSPRVVAQPPGYTRESERSLLFGIGVALPKGTVVTVRGVPRESGRVLVFTDGKREEPFADDGAGGVVARFTVEDSASLRVAARFGDVRVDDEDAIDVEMVPDEMPTVELEGAPRTERLVDVEKIDVKWVAHDDHGLREVDLVLRSGAREDRRVLGRFDGETKIERGGQVILSRDPFLRRMFLPVELTVEAKDNDPLEGPKWAKSQRITLLPPDLGQPEAERLAALVGIRDQLVDLLKWRAGQEKESRATRVSEMRERLDAIETKARKALDAAYAGATIAPGLRAFFVGQLDRLGRGRKDPTELDIESAAVAVDVAVQALGDRDAQDVAKRLADVAEDAAMAARAAREPEHKADGLPRLDTAIATIDRGAARLSELSSLGRDLGGVTRADSGRVRRARDAGNLTDAELAALHLAARLRRPTPSFGASSPSRGGGGGVESGHGNGSGQGAMPSPSDADEAFDRAADAIRALAEQHESTVRGAESALEEARRAAAEQANRDEARRLADDLRRSVEDLPLPGQDLGTPRAAAALAREHAQASAHALEDLSLKEAADSAENALGALDQAEHRLDPDDDLRSHFAGVRRALGEALAWARREAERQHAQADARAKNALEQAGDTERDLAEQAANLGSDKGPKGAALPQETADRLERAGSVMREAARELAAGNGERGIELGHEASRLLEQSGTGRSTDSESEERPKEQTAPPPDRKAHGGERSGGGDSIAIGGDVPSPDDRARAEEFRRRVIEGLSTEKSERLSPAVRRYAEGLLR